jgi:hypothetical protein
VNDRPTFNAFRNHLNCTPAAIARHDHSRRSAGHQRNGRSASSFSNDGTAASGSLKPDASLSPVFAFTDEHAAGDD